MKAVELESDWKDVTGIIIEVQSPEFAWRDCRKSEKSESG
jgi:hypothetical protein